MNNPLAMDNHSHEDLNRYFDFEESSPIGLSLNTSTPDIQDFTCSPFQHDAQLYSDSAFERTMAIELDDAKATADSEDVNFDPLSSFDDFSKWLPTYSKPAVPCDYCRSRHLECFVTFEGQTACSPCSALFRECSFVKASTEKASGGYLDTLGPVSEDFAQSCSALTSRRPLFTLGASMDDVVEDLLKHKPDKHSSRFSRSTVQILKKWLDAHSDHPYPTDEEKEDLKEQTGLTRSQISNWLANARRRGKARPKRCVSPSVLGRHSQPVNIPNRIPPGEDTRTPLERWHDSPPEHEPASIRDIARAVTSSKYELDGSGSSTRSHSAAGQHRSSSAGSMFSGWRAPSSTSMETGRSEGSQASMGSSWSHSSSRGSFNSLAKKDRRRRRRSAALGLKKGNQSPVSRPFQCTFCTDTFTSKYDWTRHEKSVHLSLEKWICAPLGPIITTSIPKHAGQIDSPMSTQCVYCQALNPTAEHIEGHNHATCEEKGLEARTFYRKDHLRQHLRLVHGVPLTTAMENWKSAPTFIRSRCGFCPGNDATFTNWADRAEHLSKHFRSGATMSSWHGTWGFDPAVEAQVTNAMPPFLIGHEGNTMRPFSGSANAEAWHSTCGPEIQPAGSPLEKSQSGLSTIPRVANCWEALTMNLGQFVREKSQLGEPITDELLQRRARYIIYGEQDEWNQTAADNPEWLALFKQTHGLGSSFDQSPAMNQEAAPEFGLEEIFNGRDSAFEGDIGSDTMEQVLFNPDDFLNDVEFTGEGNFNLVGNSVRGHTTSQQQDPGPIDPQLFQ